MADAPVEPQALEVFQKWTEITGRSQQMMMEFWAKEQGTALPSLDPLGAMATWQLAMSAAMADPQRLVALQTKYMSKLTCEPGPMPRRLRTGMGIVT